jgi:CBS domain-containing protein
MLGGRDALQDLEAEQVRRVEEAAASVGARPEAMAASSAGRGLQQLAAGIGVDRAGALGPVPADRAPAPGQGAGADRRAGHDSDSRMTQDVELREAMRPGVVPLPEDASLLEARRPMQSHGVHAVLVVGRAHGHRVPRQSFSAMRYPLAT